MFAVDRKILTPILAYLVVVTLLTGGVWWSGYVAALSQLQQRANADLTLAADSLSNELRRLRELAVLTADRSQIAQMLGGDAAKDDVRPILQKIGDKTGALDIVVLDTNGRVVTSAEGTAAGSYFDTPYFQRAMDGALGVAHPIRDGVRTFVYAAPVFSPTGPVVGVVLVFAGVEGIEGTWRGARPAVFFTDDAGVVYVSNRSELVSRSRAQGDFLDYDSRMVRGMDIWRVSGSRYVPKTALHLSKDLPVIDMTGEVLVDVAPARFIAVLQAAVAAGICLTVGGLLFLATQRRRSLADANARLERRVADRTAQLSGANLSLQREVEDRRAAQIQLQKAQADLVQAGKLSALGQMSAGISHELNQPLMAIQSYAENGQQFMARDRPDMAAQNLGKISELAHRMGRIIKNLRAFARQESEPLGDVDVAKVVADVLELLDNKIAQSGVTVDWTPIPNVIVRGGDVRLQQVVLNLASNAIDAMDQQTNPKKLAIGITRTGDKVLLSVRDTGPGIMEPEKIFDPFYTTKAVGAAEGMGLGLSISYGLVQSFGGAIRGRNLADRGAEFTIELNTAKVM